MIVFVSVHAIPQRLRGTGAALGGVGLLTVTTMSWNNFVLDSDFKWPLLAMALLWAASLGVFWFETSRQGHEVPR